MKPKPEEKPWVLAGRAYERATQWFEWSSIVAIVWMLATAVTVNAIWDSHRLPRDWWLMCLYGISSVLAFLVYRAYRNQRNAYDLSCDDRGRFGEDVRWFLRVFVPTKEHVDARLRERARAVWAACDAERKLYEQGTSPDAGYADPEYSRDRAQKRYEAALVAAKARVKQALAEFWDLHRLCGLFTPYQLNPSWKPYAGIVLRTGEGEWDGRPDDTQPRECGCPPDDCSHAAQDADLLRLASALPSQPGE